MRKLIHPLGRLLQKIQRRFQASRPGSVMILVVTLLVLMALIGTAYISTARTDRYTVFQHEVNTQAEVLMEAVKQAELGKISNVGYLSTTGQRWDDVRTDTWLASRIPTTMIEACPIWNG